MLKNTQTRDIFKQKLSFYLSKDYQSISTCNGIDCDTTDDTIIIKKILEKNDSFDYNFLFHNVFSLNSDITKFILKDQLLKINYKDNLELIQILNKILNKKRLKKTFVQNKILNDIQKKINDFNNSFTDIKNISLLKNKEEYPKQYHNSSSQIFKIEYQNGDIFYFKNIKRHLKNNNRIEVSRTIKVSQLRPCNLKFDETYNKKQLYTLIKLKIGNYTNKQIKDIILKISKNLMINDFPVSSLKIEGLKDSLSLISLEDERSLFRDFGEIITGLNFCCSDKITFSKPNEKIVDFVIHKDEINEFYSCKFTNKYWNGSSNSSLSYVLEYMKTFQLNDEEKKLYQLLSIIIDSKGSFSSYHNLSCFLGIEELSRDELLKYPVQERTKGRLIYIYSKMCKKFLNESFYRETLNKILNRLNINQVFLMYDGNNTIYFNHKNFANSSFIFESSVSVNKYNSKLNFKMDL